MCCYVTLGSKTKNNDMALYILVFGGKDLDILQVGFQ